MQKNVEPGTPLAYSEELLPGEGTYDDGEQIRAAAFGDAIVDEEMTIHIKSRGHRVNSVEKGDIIVGRIRFTKPELASVEIIAVRGKEGTLLQNVEGTLHVSKIDDRYIKDLEREYHVGDIIRAKVIGLKGGPQLVTDKPELGCIRAFSPDDQTRGLELRNGKLVDMETGWGYARKLASDYGQGIV